jgi:hypothetical protein
MFERYTEKARRVIFFGRYEASQLGSPFIETEHLLLGILRDDKVLMRLLELQIDFEAVRREVESHIEPGAKSQSLSVDLPLSDHAKRALINARDEADRLKHRYIGTQHLLLGLLSDKDFTSAAILSKFAVDLGLVRKKVEALGEQPVPSERSTPVLRRPTAPTTVEIHGIRWNVEQIRAAQARCRESFWHWEQKSWKPRDVVTTREGDAFSFDLTLAERAPEKFALVKGGWKKDYCVICRWELFESEDAARGLAFTNGRDWVCTECYQKFIARNYFGSPYSDMT